MAIRILKPTMNSRRNMSVRNFSVSKNKPEKTLTYGKTKISGRNNLGRVTVRNRGGGAKRKIREIDFSRTNYLGKKAKVVSIEYDPNRSSNIALIEYPDKDLSYIIAPEGLNENDNVECNNKTSIKTGNRMMLQNIPSSTLVYNIEIYSNGGGQIAKSAGNFATLMGLDGNYAILKLPSGEIKKFSKENFASIGTCTNSDHSSIVIGTAGRKRNMGRRPKVRGKAKNPCDHPHGGGEGGSPIGMVHPKTPWGMPALGHKTRKRNKRSNNVIIKRRNE